MSANAAAIEAGFRAKTISVRVKKDGAYQHERAARSLAEHFGEALPMLIRELSAHAK